MQSLVVGIAEWGHVQVMFGGTNINKDVSALNRGPPNILVGIAIPHSTFFSEWRMQRLVTFFLSGRERCKVAGM